MSIQFLIDYGLQILSVVSDPGHHWSRLCIVVPDSKIHGANMGPTWVLSAPDGPHVGPMNFAIRGFFGANLLHEPPLMTSCNCGPTGTKFNGILIKMQWFLFNKMNLKLSANGRHLFRPECIKILITVAILEGIHLHYISRKANLLSMRTYFTKYTAKLAVGSRTFLNL